jgi:ABC-type Na+ efflux pump permease subunit
MGSVVGSGDAGTDSWLGQGQRFRHGRIGSGETEPAAIGDDDGQGEDRERGVDEDAIAAGNARITEWAVRSLPAEPGDGPAKVLSALPLDNLLFAIGTQFIVLAAIFATMSLLVAERDSGTLAWTISKPVSRTSVLVSKWLTSTIILWVAAVVIPLALTTALVTVLHGLPDLAVVAALVVSLITVSALFVAIALAAATSCPVKRG